MERWTVDRVMALAPDSASQVAGRRLARPGPWTDVGWADALVWGSCQGSGRTPYKVAVDLSGPSYTCTCPSRKFPCKHTLGLLFLWSEGQIEPGGGLAADVAAWAASRSRDVAPDADAAERTATQKAHSEARASQRDERVASGLDELDRWLIDQISAGLVTTTTSGFVAAERMAARMVDAQVPGAASRLRSLVETVSSPDPLGSLLGELALLRLLVTANSAPLPDDLRATLRSHLGYTTGRAEVLARPPVADHWLVTGMKDSDEDQVATRQVWLLGRRTGRVALVLFFTPRGQQVDNSLLPGMVVDASLHFYPGRPELRAAVGENFGDVGLQDWRPGGGTVPDARNAWTDAVAADPWIRQWPVAIEGTLHARPGWAVRDAHADTVPVVAPVRDLARMLCLVGSAPTTWFGEVSGAGFQPTSVLVGGRVVIP